MRILLLTILLVGAPLLALETEPEPPANNAVPPKATGPLSPQEETFQGDWKAYDLFKSNRLEYAMTFEGRDFHVRARPDDKDRDEWYEGYIVLRTDVDRHRLISWSSSIRASVDSESVSGSSTLTGRPSS